MLRNGIDLAPGQEDLRAASVAADGGGVRMPEMATEARGSHRDCSLHADWGPKGLPMVLARTRYLGAAARDTAAPLLIVTVRQPITRTTAASADMAPMMPSTT